MINTQPYRKVVITRQYAPAKINVGLRVMAKRDDGYHDLSTIMFPIELSDTVSFYECDEIAFWGDVITNDLVIQATELLKRYRKNDLGIAIEVTKRIPAGAGLGGGSSDAATVLMFLNEYWECGLSTLELEQLSFEIGSDIALFITAQNHDELCGYYLTGRGIVKQTVTPLLENINVQLFNPLNLSTWVQDIILVIPKVTISTAEAFKHVEISGKDDVLKNYHALLSSEEYIEIKNDFDSYVNSQTNGLVIKLKMDSKLKKMSRAIFVTGSGSGMVIIPRKRTDDVIRYLETLHTDSEIIVSNVFNQPYAKLMES